MKLLSRRAVLRGLGVCIALPWLDAMVGSRARASEGPRRLLVLTFPNGARMDAWTPQGHGQGWLSTPSLAPLEPHRQRLTVFSGADNARVPGIHAERNRSLLSEVWGDLTRPTFGRSFDRIAADVLAGDSAFPHLALGTEAVTSCAGPSHCDWLANVSWDGQEQPVLPDLSPASVFARLFGDAGGLSASALARRQRRDQSVLDAVLADHAELQASLGPADRARVDEHLTAIREVERRLTLPGPDPASCGALPPDPPTSAEHLTELMLDLATLALRCDRSRVVSLMLGAGESYRALAPLGFNTSWHAASHNDPIATEAAATWSVQRFAGLLDRLSTGPDALGRTLLDDVTAVLVSDMSNGAEHDPTDVPLVIAGGAVALPFGEHRALAAGTPLSDVWLTLLRGLGHDGAQLGDYGVDDALW